MSIRGRVERVIEAGEKQRRNPLVALTLELDETPEWAERLDSTRVVRLIGEESATARSLLARWRKRPEQSPEGVIVLPAKRAASAFIVQAAVGPAREVACLGARGDRKTTSGVQAALLHAAFHEAAGHPLPTTWLVVTGTLSEHKVKLIRSLQASHWAGIWSFRDEWRLAVATIGGREIVHLMLMGLEDQNAGNRVRTEAHALWFEEPASAMVMETASGLTEDAWGLALTSLRLPSHHRPAILTENYPDEDHWTWTRFVVKKHPGTAVVRIPAGESASEEDRALWRQALEGRPDLMRRLLDGQPGVIAEGPQVAVGFRTDLHVGTGRLEPIEGVPLVLGHDAGLTPVTVIGQEVRGELRTLAALASERAGTRQHVEALVLPWLAVYAQWVLRAPSTMLLHFYDPSMDVADQSNLEQSPLRVLREVLGGTTYPGAVSWPGRRDPILTLLNRLNPLTGRPVLQLDPEGCRLLISALSGRWHYPMLQGRVSRELPAKTHPWSDLGDAFAYMVGGITPQPVVETKPIEVITEFDPRETFAPWGMR